MKSILKILVTVSFLAFSACATSHPEQVPEIDRREIPALMLKNLNPQVLEVSVSNHRKVNATAGNSNMVEQAIQSCVEDSAKRGGLAIGKSKNQLNLKIDDCKNVKENFECVKITGLLTTPRFKLEMSGQMTNGTVREGSSYSLYGDVSQAYQGSLQTLLSSLDEKVEEMQSPQK
jgi:hypothetical protein